MGIVTFDDNELFRINTPTITAIAQPLNEWGKALMMLKILNSKNNKYSTDKIVLEASLIVRESSKEK